MTFQTSFGYFSLKVFGNAASTLHHNAMKCTIQNTGKTPVSKEEKKQYRKCLILNRVHCAIYALLFVYQCFTCKWCLICAYFSPDIDAMAYLNLFTGESNIMERGLF